jgi:predicted ATPase
LSHGAVFVDLVPIPEPALVTSALAMALGVRDVGDRRAVRTAVDQHSAAGRGLGSTQRGMLRYRWKRGAWPA